MLYHKDMSWHQGLFETGKRSEGEQIRTAHQELSKLSAFLTTHADAEVRAPDAFALATAMKSHLEQ